MYDFETSASIISGALEAGCGMTMRVQRLPKGMYVYPEITLGCDPMHNPYISLSGILEELVKNLGGHTSPKPPGPYTGWRIQGHPAVRVTEAGKGSAPQRKAEIDLYRSWSQDTDLNRRIEVAREFDQLRRRKRYDSVSPEDYKNLITHKAFLTGVFIARGLLYHPRNVNNDYVRITGKNQPLIEAIRQRWGGSIYSHTNANGLNLSDLRLCSIESTRAFLGNTMFRCLTAF